MENQLSELFFNKRKISKKGRHAISSDAAKALGISKNNETKLHIVGIKAIENSKNNAENT